MDGASSLAVPVSLANQCLNGDQSRSNLLKKACGTLEENLVLDDVFLANLIVKGVFHQYAIDDIVNINNGLFSLF